MSLVVVHSDPNTKPSKSGRNLAYTHGNPQVSKTVINPGSGTYISVMPPAIGRSTYQAPG